MKDKPVNLSEATLRAYLDGELSPLERRRVTDDLTRSPAGEAELARLRRMTAGTAAHLARLAPPDAARSSAPQALARLQRRLTGQSEPKKHHHFRERMSVMFSKSFVKRYQPALTALGLVLALAVALSFAPVRAAAGDLLNIFRVQQVKVVPVDATRLEDLENNEEFTSLMDQFSMNREVLEDGGKPHAVPDLAAAAVEVGFQPAQVTDVPAQAGQLDEIQVQGRSIYQLNLDPDLIEAIFAAAEIKVDLPDSLKDEPVTVTKPAAVMQTWHNGDDTALGLGLMQLPSPQIEYPDELDLNALGLAGLQLLGYSDEDAAALAGAIDWTNTLLLPVPTDGEVTVSEVSINGAKGTLFSGAGDGPEAGVMWQKDGMTYMLTGPFSGDQLVAIAQSVR